MRFEQTTFSRCTVKPFSGDSVDKAPKTRATRRRRSFMGHFVFYTVRPFTSAVDALCAVVYYYIVRLWFYGGEKTKTIYLHVFDERRGQAVRLETVLLDHRRGSRNSGGDRLLNRRLCVWGRACGVRT